MLYQIKDGTVSAGGQTILSHVDFYIKEKEKIAVVGKNGAGKTTLLRLLAGELTPDRDDSRGSYGRSNDMVTGAATAGSDLDGTAKRAQRAKKKKPSGNPETGITMSRNITIDMLRQVDKSNQDLTIEQILLESCPVDRWWLSYQSLLCFGCLFFSPLLLEYHVSEWYALFFKYGGYFFRGCGDGYGVAAACAKIFRGALYFAVVF